jgi:endonuclease G
MKSKFARFPLLVALVLAFYGCATAPRRDDLQSKSAVESTRPLATVSVPALTPESNPATIGGFPIVRSGEPVKLLTNIGYTVAYSERLQSPIWAAYFCEKPTFAGTSSRPGFKPDPRISQGARLKDDDFDNGENYDRGHLAPDAAIEGCWGLDAMRGTYWTTNITPQKADLNRYAWGGLEGVIRKFYGPKKEGVWVIVGPIFREPVRRLNGKASIPAGYFCIVLDRRADGQLHALVAQMDQGVEGTKHQLSEFTRGKTMRGIEAATGLNFCSQLADAIENRLETSLTDDQWGDWILAGSAHVKLVEQ